jgi:hypothetical protein
MGSRFAFFPSLLFYFLVGGKFLNSLCMALLNVFTFLSELSASVSLATPRHTISLSELSTRSTVRVASFSW